MHTVDMVQEALDELEAKPDIARFLLKAGITGARNDMCRCPVAAFIQRRSGGIRYLSVEAGCVEFRDDRYLDEMDVLYTEPGVAGFIAAFDNGEHPELEKTP